jgi:tetratricopeptide (TPR) repeat protein
MRALIEKLDLADSRVSVMPPQEGLGLFEELLAHLRAAIAAPNAEAHRLFTSARKVLHGLPLDMLSTARVEGLLLSAQFAYVSGQPFSGLEHASFAVECARRMKDGAALRKALTFHGILLADTGNIASAVEAYAEALEIAESMHDLRAETPVWVNLGSALTYAGQLSDAVSWSRRWRLSSPRRSPTSRTSACTLRTTPRACEASRRRSSRPASRRAPRSA